MTQYTQVHTISIVEYKENDTHFPLSTSYSTMHLKSENMSLLGNIGTCALLHLPKTACCL